MAEEQDGETLSLPQIHQKNIQMLSLTTSECWQRTSTHCLQKEVGKNIKEKKRNKRGRDGDPSWEGSLKKERRFQTPGNTFTGESVASLGTSEDNITRRKRE